jgi:hypothetical protein
MAFTLGTKDHGHHFEAEAAADYGEVSGTIVADAAASGGSYTALSWTSAAEVAISNWALTGGEANYFGGGKYAIMARLAGTVAYTDLYLRFTFGSNATIGSVTYFTPEWSGSLFKVPLRHEIFQIDTPYLPPYIPVGGSGTISAKTICLYGLKGDGSAVIMNLDYFNMLPVSPESELNYLTCNTVAGVAQNEYLIGDWINQSVYKTGTVDSDYSVEFIQQQGKGIYLTPGQNSRVYVYVEGFAGTCDPFRTHVVSMWYSPRYRTV